MSLIKEAEQNVLNICSELEMALSAIDGFRNFGNRALKDYVSKPQFFEGLEKIRAAVYQEYINQISRCFALSGLGGEGAAKYAKEKAKCYFGGHYEVMSFLDKWGNFGRYSVAKEKQFRQELQTALSENKNEPEKLKYLKEIAIEEGRSFVELDIEQIDSLIRMISKDEE